MSLPTLPTRWDKQNIFIFFSFLNWLGLTVANHKTASVKVSVGQSISFFQVGQSGNDWRLLASEIAEETRPHFDGEFIITIFVFVSPIVALVVESSN